jgi:hypothetical protein
MINRESNPVEWAAFMYELEDANEHLATLISELGSVKELSEEDFAVQMAHIYSHLNRAWSTRNTLGTISEVQRHSASQYPRDLEPI